MKDLIEKTTTKSGLKVFACIFNQIYETGRKVAAGFKESMRIVFDALFGRWNYVAVPEKKQNKLSNLFHAHSLRVMPCFQLRETPIRPITVFLKLKSRNQKLMR